MTDEKNPDGEYDEEKPDGEDDEKKPDGEYKVGYRRPPKSGQFKKGKSGNPAGAPSKPKQTPTDVAATLNEPITVKTSGGSKKMPAFEVGVRKLVQRGLKQGNLNAILEFLTLCESHRLLVPPPVEHGGGVIVAPKDVDFNVWFESVTETVPDTSSDDDDDYY